MSSRSTQLPLGPNYILRKDPGSSRASEYRLARRLGSGSFAEVWRCEPVDPQNGRTCAVKFMHPSKEECIMEEVDKHLRALTECGGCYVPRLYDVSPGEVADPQQRVVGKALALQMQLVDGLSLAGVCDPAQAPLSVGAAAAAVTDVLRALSRLHTVDIIHRDVKPANILVDRDGAALLGDFGIALFPEDYEGVYEMSVAGSPFYMAPETVKTVPTRYNVKVDVWALGVVGYELAAGRTPLQEPGVLPGYSQDDIFKALRCMPEWEMPSTRFGPRYDDFLARCCELEPTYREPTRGLAQDGFVQMARARQLGAAVRAIVG